MIVTLAQYFVCLHIRIHIHLSESPFEYDSFGAHMVVQPCERCCSNLRYSNPKSFISAILTSLDSKRRCSERIRRRRKKLYKRQQIILYRKSYTHSHWRIKEYVELRKPPWKISTTFISGTQVLFFFCRFALPFRIHFVRLDFKWNIFSMCMLVQIRRHENVATAARVVQYIRYENDERVRERES